MSRLRDNFEEWAKRCRLPLDRFNAGEREYVNDKSEAAWRAWRSSACALLADVMEAAHSGKLQELFDEQGKYLLRNGDLQ